METVLITGANRGIGLALAQVHAARGDHVIGACRQDSEALRASGAQVLDGIDVTEDRSLSKLARELQGVHVHRLWLNAGVLGREKLGGLDAAAMASVRNQFEVNALGPLRVAQAVIDHLPSGAKIGITTSRMGSIADNDSGGYYGYRASKAAVNAIGKSLAVDLRPIGIAVYLLHPGYVATEMVGGSGDISAQVAAERMVALVDKLDLDESGSFWHSNGSALPW